MSSASSATTLPVWGGFTEVTFETFLKGRDEPSWLIERRKEAFAVFQATPWPTSRDEEWRRTDIRTLKLDAFAPPARQEPTPEARAAIEPYWSALSGLYGTGIEQVNAVATRAADPAKLDGAVFVDLGRAVEDYPDLLKRYLLTDAVTARVDLFAALHAAFWTGGTLLYVPRGVKVEAPLFSLVGLAREGRVDFDHTLIVLDERAEPPLVRETSGSDRGEGAAL